LYYNAVKMNQYNLQEDIKVFYISATSFPAGVQEAHQQLHRLVPFSPERMYFGISRPGPGGAIEYKAAASELTEGDLSIHGLSAFIIQKGIYVFTDIPDFMKNIPAIGKTFQLLLTDKTIDPNGACIEWYMTEKNCRCMVRTILK
jgi:hypothetical protein